MQNLILQRVRSLEYRYLNRSYCLQIVCDAIDCVKVKPAQKYPYSDQSNCFSVCL
jgi:hypothetical protein